MFRFKPIHVKLSIILIGTTLVGLLLSIIVLNTIGGAYDNQLWAAVAFALGFTLTVVGVCQVAGGRHRLALVMMAIGLLIFAFLPAIVSAQGTPAIDLSVDDRVPEVDEEVTVAWRVTGADSVSVRRNGVQISTQHNGQRSETIADRSAIVWTVEASNRSGSVNGELTVEPATIGSIASWVTGGNPSGSWVTQIILSLIPGAVIVVVSILRGQITPGPFIAGGICMPAVAFVYAALVNQTAAYWLAAALTVMLVLAIVGWRWLSDD